MTKPPSYLFLSLLFTAFLFAAAPAHAITEDTTPNSSPETFWQLQQSWDKGDYKIELWNSLAPPDAKDDSDGYLIEQKIIIRQGEAIRDIFVDQKLEFDRLNPLGNDAPEAETSDDDNALPFTNVTGRSADELVIEGWSGGAHCCSTIYVVRLGNSYKRVLELPTFDAGVEFLQLAGDAGYEIRTGDTAFTYWNTSFATSPIPTVIMTYDWGSDTYMFAGWLMRKTGLNADKISQLEEELGADEWVNEPMENTMLIGPTTVTPLPPSALWSIMLEYIYAGRWNVAVDYMKKKWPPATAGKEEFLTSFTCQLRKSRWWRDLAGLNSLPENFRANDCPVEIEATAPTPPADVSESLTP
jgi:hypothetical protein